jgi:hypothetical protein
METSSPKKLGGGKAHHAARCTLINSQVKTQLILQKNRTSARFAALSSSETFEFLS